MSLCFREQIKKKLLLFEKEIKNKEKKRKVEKKKKEEKEKKRKGIARHAKSKGKQNIILSS